MAIAAKFLDLPNELLTMVFGYLSSADLVLAFIEIRSNRLRALISPFIQQLDLTDSPVLQIEKHLPLVNRIYGTHCVRLRDQQLGSVAASLSTSNIGSAKVLSGSITDLLDQKKWLEQLTSELTSLSVDFGNGMEADQNLVSVLFNRHSKLEDLAIRNCTLFFDESALHPSAHLKSLHIETEGTHHVFLLLKHCRALETLSVRTSPSFARFHRI